MNEIGCLVVLRNDKIVSWRMNSDITAEDADAHGLDNRYFGPYNPADCRVEVKIFYSDSDPTVAGWGADTEGEARQWRKQWDIDPWAKGEIEAGRHFAPYPVCGPPPTYYAGNSNSEILAHEDIDEAIGAELEQMLSPGMAPKEILRALPDEIEIHGYDRMEPDLVGYTAFVVNRLLESLDETYSDPGGDCTIPTKGMLAAAEEFVKKVLAEYTPWACEKVSTETVNVREWVEKHRPGWLEEDKS